MSNEFSHTLPHQDPKTLSLVPRHKNWEKGLGYTFLYVLCQQSSFGVEESRLSIANYWNVKVVDSFQNHLKTGMKLARPQD